MIERPLQHAVDDQIGIAADWRREMRVLVEGQREMPEGLGGVARLLERAQHQEGDDAFLRLARNFFRQALVVIGTNVDVQGRNGNSHGPVAPALTLPATARPAMPSGPTAMESLRAYTCHALRPRWRSERFSMPSV